MNVNIRSSVYCEISHTIVIY